MKKNKGDLISIIFAGVLLAIVLGMIVISLQQVEKPLPSQTKVAQEPTSVPINAESNTLTIYDKPAQDKLMEKIQNRQPLSTNDAFAKATILSLLPKGKPSGVIHESPNIIIDYTESANMFQVEILTTDVDQAKAEANLWFRARGMSQKGICDLPLMFYLGSETRTEFQQTNTPFNPLANGC